MKFYYHGEPLLLSVSRNRGFDICNEWLSSGCNVIATTPDGKVDYTWHTDDTLSRLAWIGEAHAAAQTGVTYKLERAEYAAELDETDLKDFQSSLAQSEAFAALPDLVARLGESAQTSAAIARIESCLQLLLWSWK